MGRRKTTSVINSGVAKRGGAENSVPLQYSTRTFKLHEIDQFGQVKIFKIVATRSQFLQLKCTKFDFGAPPKTPLGKLTALPQIFYLDFKGPTSKGGRNREGRDNTVREKKRRNQLEKKKERQEDEAPQLKSTPLVINMILKKRPTKNANIMHPTKIFKKEYQKGVTDFSSPCKRIRANRTPSNKQIYLQENAKV